MFGILPEERKNIKNAAKAIFNRLKFWNKKKKKNKNNRSQPYRNTNIIQDNVRHQSYRTFNNDYSGSTYAFASQQSSRTNSNRSSNRYNSNNNTQRYNSNNNTQRYNSNNNTEEEKKKKKKKKH